MKRFIFVAAIAALPAIVGTALMIVPALATPTIDDTSGSPVSSNSVKQKTTPTVKGGGLVNTDVTPQQARRTTQQTNRQLARGDIKRDTDTDNKSH